MTVVASIASLLLVLGAARVDEPGGGRPMRTSAAYSEIVRARALGATTTFAANAQALDPGTALLFEVFSEDTRGRRHARWSCLATQDVADCFARPVEIAYEQADARVVLRVTPVSR